MQVSKVFVNHFITNVINTSVSFFIVSLSFVALYFLFAKRCDTKKKKGKLRIRLLYIAVFILVLVLAKIWVEGFEHIFTMLSIVAAGLVVTNKETIMNFIGWLIINWKGLFVAGDFIQIQNYAGYVDSVGVLYFKLYETSSVDQRCATGRSIKIPNGQVITAPIINFSPETNLYLYTLSFFKKENEDLAKIVEKSYRVIKELLEQKYHDSTLYGYDHVSSHNRKLASLINFEPRVQVVPSTDKVNETKIKVWFYCYPADYQAIENVFWERRFAN